MSDSMIPPLPRLALLPALLLAVVAFPHESAAQNSCRTLEVDMTPVDDLQIVMWLEDESGVFQQTVFITSLTGRYGIGNRPGRFDFNSGPLWPYGRRVGTFPVWAHRHGEIFPQVVFQNNDTNNLSHPLSQSSLERQFCRPIRPTEPLWDAASCASVVYTDKGQLSGEQTSLYPPRSDLAFDRDRDHDSVQMMAGMNPFDSVSQPTPIGGGLFTARWSIPTELADGDYVLFIEVSKEFDRNAFHDYPSPDGIPWSEYGEAYRGQPSVVYSVNVSVIDGSFEAETTDYVGYGDPDGIDGVLRPPDTSITTGTPGSGAARLLLTSDGSAMYRARIRTQTERDVIAPGSPSELVASGEDGTSAQIGFIAPGDDDDTGLLAAYEIRYQAGTPITEDNWDSAQLFGGSLTPNEPGTIENLTLEGLIPQTNYFVGIRAIDNCLNESALETVALTTAPIEVGEVDYCFVATAAYGSLLANDVSVLRSFRDTALRGHVAGELAVMGYYTFGPAFAKVIAPSDTARSLARASLAPLVRAAKSALRGR